MRLLSYLFLGLLFALGLGLAGMVQPLKVFEFLDVTGNWDPSLAFVMMGGIGTHLLLYRFIVKRPSPLLAPRFMIPTRTDLTPRLVIGSALFGVGWALAGVCPGPGLVSLASGSWTAVLFAVSMMGGMLLFKLVDPLLGRAAAPDPATEAQGSPELQGAVVELPRRE